MEDSRLTQVTLDIVRRVHSHAGLRGAVGVVIQAYLYRSQADIEQLLADGIRVRLCKGAYKEPPKSRSRARLTWTPTFSGSRRCSSTAPFTTRWPRTTNGIIDKNEGLRQRGRDRSQPLRISNVVWSPSRFAAQAGKPGLQSPHLRSLWQRVVPLLHAPPGRASGQCDLWREISSAHELPAVARRWSVPCAADGASATSLQLRTLCIARGRTPGSDPPISESCRCAPIGTCGRSRKLGSTPRPDSF